MFETFLVQDFHLYRVWDSTVLENEEQRKSEWGLKHEGALDGEQAVGLMRLGP